MANINGTSQDDVLRGTTTADVIWARSGNDRISGLAGHDRLYGEAGNDTIYGGDGNDRIGGGFGNDQLFGHAGHDTLFGDAGRDYLWGGAGDDELNGGADNDVLRGNSGNDILRGDGGNDLLDGGAGNDLLYGGSGADHFIGGDGIDTVSYVDNHQGVFVHLASAYAPDSFPELEDHLTYEALAGVERVRGSLHDDALFGVMMASEEELNTPIALFGLSGNDSITGGFADDELEGNDGNDFIDGKIGDDRINGGAGADHVDGGFGAGDDRLTGGSGEDSFVYRVDHRLDGSGTTGADVITDFHAGEDVLRWSTFVEADPNNGQPIAGISYAAELFGELDTNSDGKISGLDAYADSKLVGGVRSLVVGFSAFLNAELAAGHDLKGTLSGDTLTLLGVNTLRAQDIDVA